MAVQYSREHQWIDSSTPDAARVGITPFAQETLGDIVFVDLPAVGKTFQQGEVAAVVESVKTAADVFMPASGEIVAINEALRDDPAMANTDPLGAAWFFTVRISDPSQLDGLMDETAYAAFAKDA
jgi:glycine cleavage system H protein